MAETYTVKAVKKEPKEWQSKYGPMLTYLIQVEGNGEPVQLNRKPDSPAPKVGDELYGTITETEFGQKLTLEQQAPGKTGGGGYTKSTDRESIYRCNALNNAVAFIGEQPSDTTVDYVEGVLETADRFYVWLKGEAQADKPDLIDEWETANQKGSA